MEFETWDKDTLIKAIKMEAEKVITANVLKRFSVNPLSKDELYKKPTQQLKEMYLQLKNNNLSFLKQHEKLQENDETRFFNHPECNADYSYWTRQAYWSIEEAIALLLGKNPKIVSYEALKNVFEISPFAKKYKELHSTAGRYVLIGELQELVPPSVFLTWAKRLKIDIPTDLKEAINSIEVQDLKNQDLNISEQSALDNLKEKERQSLYKIIAAMAYDWLGYDPESKSPIPTEIANAITTHLGEELDVGTVRKWLGKACKRYPKY